MRMDRQLAETREFEHPDKTDGIEARHEAGRAMLYKRVVAATHLLEIAGQIEGVHDFLAGALCVIVDHTHDGFDAPVKGTSRAVRLQFVVLDKVDSGMAELADESCSLFRTEPNTRLDDRTDQWPSLHSGEAPRSTNAKARPRIGRSELLWQADVEKAQASYRIEFEEIARNRCQQVRQRRSERVERPRECEVDPPKACSRLEVDPCRGERRTCHYLINKAEPRHLCCHARLHLFGLPRDGHERAARLLASHQLGNAARIASRFK